MFVGRIHRLMAVFVLIVPTAVSAKNCLKVDDENRPAATLTGRITAQHKALGKNTELRAAEGPYLRLDSPLQADLGAGCTDWREIPILDSEHTVQLAKDNKRHVTISGELGRFGSALVYPPILSAFIPLSRRGVRREDFPARKLLRTSPNPKKRASESRSARAGHSGDLRLPKKIRRGPRRSG
jgi:hypothetical protein